ncbi:MAG TPA: hypothetical protein ENJ08_07675 [Gammaproteobacteria bacterium]|nr:hypothetical protein [Gammaproteobacteria bacterium]
MSWTNLLKKPDLSGINVPEWVRFIAQDIDGRWWGYSVEPLQNHRGWYENEVGEHIRLVQGKASERWRESLIRVKIV